MFILAFRAFILYFWIIIVMRLMGKREIGQLQPYELAITLIISELVTLPMENNGIPLLNGIIPTLVITVTQVLLSFLSLKWQWLQDTLSGTYTIMIKNGKLIEKNLLNQKYNITELLEQLRMNGVTKISDVEYAILETSGKLSVILKPAFEPITASQMNIVTEYEGLPINLILDGKIVKKNLPIANLTESQVLEKLATSKVSLKEVFYASVNATGEYFIQKKEDKEN